MKKTRLFVIVFLVVLCGCSWLWVLGGIVGKSGELHTLEKQGEEYYQAKLYQLSAESYQAAVNMDPSRSHYQSLIQTYEAFYEENHSSSVRKKLVAAYDDAVKAFPKEVSFWEGYAYVYSQNGNVPNVLKVVERAGLAHVSSDALQEMWQKAYYSWRSMAGRYNTITLYAAEGLYSAETGKGAVLLDVEGSDCLEGIYRYVGPAGEDGTVVCVTEAGEVQLLSCEGKLLARFGAPVVEARGYGQGLIPVRLEGRGDWCYLNHEGEEVLGGFREVGMFVGGKAPVQMASGEWCLIGPDGSQASKNTWEELKIDANGRFREGGALLLKTDGCWKVCTTGGDVKGELNGAEAVDDCHNGEPIAFCRGGKWGYVTVGGDILMEPAFEQARSFSGGVAAVQVGGKWGFIDESGNTVIEPLFANAGYFDPDSGTCPVQLEGEDFWRLIAWKENH